MEPVEVETSSQKVAKNKEDEIAFKAGVLDVYTGKYYSEELDVNYRVRSNDNRLLISVKYNEPVALEPTAKDEFKGNITLNYKGMNQEVSWL